MGTEQLKELKRLQKENERLRRAVSDQSDHSLSKPAMVEFCSMVWQSSGGRASYQSKETFVKATLFKLFAVLLLIGEPGVAQDHKTISIALGDNPDEGKAALELAIARTAARGVDVQISFLQSEDIAAQAVLSGQADIGVGAPYVLMQDHDPSVRMFFQLNRLRFFPVVNTDYYRSWSDLDGADIFVHGAGSGSEALVKHMAKEEGITFGSVRYLPGSGVRAHALIRGRIAATVVDAQRMKFLTKESEGTFTVLPSPNFMLSDDVLFAKQDYIVDNREKLQVFVEELLGVFRDINEGPSVFADGMREFGLLDSLSKNEIRDLAAYYEFSVSLASFSNTGGYGEIGDDMQFYGLSGDQDLNDFWDFTLLRDGLKALEGE